MSIHYIRLKGNNPYYNLAAEEYLLKNIDQDILMLWQGENSVVVGKHQNALSEINHRYVYDQHIKVARRLSGGGTVFHDHGNLNFSFIRTMNRPENIRFTLFTQPILQVLNQLPLRFPAVANNRSDLLIDGKKISGNAEHLYKKKVLHHGTLLFNSQLGKLNLALKADLSRFKDKSVQSNRSEVANISDYLDQSMTLGEFAEFMEQGLQQCLETVIPYDLNDEDDRAINQLCREKYQTWEWIYGYSPKYEYFNELKTARGSLAFHFFVEKGLIRHSDWKGPFSEILLQQLASAIQNCPHHYNAMKESMVHCCQQLKKEAISPEKLLAVLL